MKIFLSYAWQIFCPRPDQQACRYFAATLSSIPLVLIAGLLITVLLFLEISRLEYDKLEAELERRSAERVDDVKMQLENVVADLESVNRLFSTVGEVSREQFHSFTKPLLARNPRISHFTFQRLISHAERPAYEAGMQRAMPNFAIAEIEDGKLLPAGARDQYRIIEYAEPVSKNAVLIGIDAATRKEQEDAVFTACRSGLPTTTKPYVPFHSKKDERRFVMLMAVYKGKGMPPRESERCNNVKGYTVAVFNGINFTSDLRQADRQFNDSFLTVLVYADVAANPDSFMYGSKNPGTAGATLVNAVSSLLYAWPEKRAETFYVAGRPWHVVVSATAIRQLKFRMGSLLALCGGILLTLVSVVYLYQLGRYSRRMQDLADTRQNELEKLRLLLEENRILGHELCRIRALFEQAPGFVAMLNGPSHIFQIANAEYRQLVGRNDLIGKSVKDALPEVVEQGYIEILDQVYVTGQPYIARDTPVVLRRRPDGTDEIMYLDFIYQPIVDTDARVSGILVQGTDRSRERHAQMRLEHFASHDALTDLPGQSLFRGRLGNAILQAGESGESFAVMVLDVDRFKNINESMGHYVGDSLLKEITTRLQCVLDNQSVLSRQGGDKFILIQSAGQQEDGYFILAQRILDVVAQPIQLNGEEIVLTCSIGITVYPFDTAHEDELIFFAELAMLDAKARGGNQYRTYTPQLSQRTRERLKLEGALRKAVEREEFELHYQPQIDLVTGRVVGMEALIRWRHPELGMVPPSEFIGLAEETGLIVPIGVWVLRTACTQAKTWQDAGLGNFKMAVNLSARQFSEPDLLPLIAKTLEETGLAANCLDIELTESLVMSNVENMIGLLHQLSELGVQLSIDDFGTGYSSLAYLKRFPIDVLKIDRAFVREISTNPNDAAISEAIISMAHSLGIKVVAEGVETEAQCEFLARNMCDEIQGFLFSEALVPGEMAALLREERALPQHLLRMHKPSRTLLLVDDEPSILSALRRQLRGNHYEILTANNGPEGLALLEQHPVDVIVSDQRMPGMTGVDFLRTVKTLHPETVRIVLSGFTELQSVTDAVNEGAIYKFLTKPWEDDQLRAHIDEAFRHKEMEDENRRLNLEVRTANQELAKANRQLEELLRQKQQQIINRQVSLDIVREALQHVPMPVIGLDEDDIIVFVNAAADALFVDMGPLLGEDASQLMPSLIDASATVAEGERFAVAIDGKEMEALVRSMGQGTQSRGKLITLHEVVHG